MWPLPFWIFVNAAREDSRPLPPMHLAMWLFIDLIEKVFLQFLQLAEGVGIGLVLRAVSEGVGEEEGESWLPLGVPSLPLAS